MKKEVMIVVAVIGGLICLAAGFSLLSLILFNKGWAVLGAAFVVPAIICLAGFLYLTLGGLITVQPQSRMVVEVLGQYLTQLRPGLQWVCPILMKIRGEVEVWEQSVKLFEEGDIKVDMIDGSAKLKDVRAFVKIKNPDTTYDEPEFPSSTGHDETGVYRSIYEVDDWIDKTQDLLENAVRSHLGRLDIDQALREGKGGYDILGPNRLPSSEKKKIVSKMSSWGLELTKLTITDFDLDDDTVAAREAVQKAKKRAEAAREEIQTRSCETIGAYVQMLADGLHMDVEEVQEEIKQNPERKKRIEAFAEDLISRQMSIDGKALLDLRGSGNPLLELVAAWRKLGPSNSP